MEENARSGSKSNFFCYRCDEFEGYYTDEEISIQAQGNKVVI